MNALAEQWPLLVVGAYIIISAAVALLSEWCNPRGEDDRAAKRERDWYGSEFMRRATIRSFQPGRAAMLRRINAVMSWLGIPWRLQETPPDEES